MKKSLHKEQKENSNPCIEGLRATLRSIDEANDISQKSDLPQDDLHRLILQYLTNSQFSDLLQNKSSQIEALTQENKELTQQINQQRLELLAAQQEASEARQSHSYQQILNCNLQEKLDIATARLDNLLNDNHARLHVVR